MSESPLLQTESESALKFRWSLAERGHLTVPAFFDRNAGLFLIMASELFFCLAGVTIRLLNGLDKQIPILEVVFVRTAIVYVFSVGYMCWQKIPNPFLGPKEVRPLLVMRGLAGFVTFFAVHFSLEYILFSDVVLEYITPILTGFSGAIFLKERLSSKHVCAGLCGSFGVVLIAGPRFLVGGLPGNGMDNVTPGQRVISVTAALVIALAETVSYTLLRAIGKRANALHVNAYYSGQWVLVSAISMRIFHWQIPPVIPTGVLSLVLIFLVGIFSLIGQTLLAMGFQRETVSRGSFAIYTSVVFSVVLEFILFEKTPTSLSIFGAIIIMGTTIYVSLTKQATTRLASDACMEQGPGATPVHDGDRDRKAKQ